MKAIFYLAISLYMVACSQPKQETSEATPSPVSTHIETETKPDSTTTDAVSGATNVANATTFNGIFIVAPQQQATVSALMGGIVESTSLLVGKSVKKGDVIAVLDNPEFINGVTALYTKANPKAAEDPSFKNMFRNAPTVVFIANDPSYDCSQIDCGLLGGNMILSAQSMGIGSCCLGGPARFMKQPEAAEYLKKLNFSEGYELLYCIAFGYPDEAPAAKPRNAEKIKFID